MQQDYLPDDAPPVWDEDALFEAEFEQIENLRPVSSRSHSRARSRARSVHADAADDGFASPTSRNPAGAGPHHHGGAQHSTGPIHATLFSADDADRGIVRPNPSRAMDALNLQSSLGPAHLAAFADGAGHGVSDAFAHRAAPAGTFPATPESLEHTAALDAWASMDDLRPGGVGLAGASASGGTGFGNPQGSRFGIFDYPVLPSDSDDEYEDQNNEDALAPANAAAVDASATIDTALAGDALGTLPAADSLGLPPNTSTGAASAGDGQPKQMKVKKVKKQRNDRPTGCILICGNGVSRWVTTRTQASVGLDDDAVAAAGGDAGAQEMDEAVTAAGRRRLLALESDPAAADIAAVDAAPPPTSVNGAAFDGASPMGRIPALKPDGAASTAASSPPPVALPDMEEVRDGRSAKDGALWVSRYAPRKYAELLSDETINLEVLQWLAQWKRYAVAAAGTLPPGVSRPSAEALQAMRPTESIALITGPPGVGKTTLAHVCAKHCGFEVVELNASVQRTLPELEHVIVSTVRNSGVAQNYTGTTGSTQLTLGMGTASTTQPQSAPGTSSSGAFGGDAAAALMRAKCLVLDELDGVAAGVVPLLLKQDIHRPVICLANNLYAPSLRQLRTTLGFVRQVPALDMGRLATRLQHIARMEGHEMPRHVLSDLAAFSGGDVRCCLNTLQFLCRQVAAANAKRRAEHKRNLAQAGGAELPPPPSSASTAVEMLEHMKGKDTTLSLWSLWADVFERKERQKYFQLLAKEDARAAHSAGRTGSSYAMTANSVLIPASGRGADPGYQFILHRLAGCGDLDALLSGLFEHYTQRRYPDAYLTKTAAASEWLAMHDIATTKAYRSQGSFGLAHDLGIYTAARVFASCASLTKGGPRLGFPKESPAVAQRLAAVSATLDDFTANITDPRVRPFWPASGGSSTMIATEIAPLFSRCLQAPFKVPMNFNGPSSLPISDQPAFHSLVALCDTYGITFVDAANVRSRFQNLGTAVFDKEVDPDAEDAAANTQGAAAGGGVGIGGFGQKQRLYGLWAMAPDMEVCGFMKTRKLTGEHASGTGGSLMAWQFSNRGGRGGGRGGFSAGGGRGQGRPKYTGPPRMRDDLKRVLVAEIQRLVIRRKAEQLEIARRQRIAAEDAASTGADGVIGAPGKFGAPGTSVVPPWAAVKAATPQTPSKANATASASPQPSPQSSTNKASLASPGKPTRILAVGGAKPKLDFFGRPLKSEKLHSTVAKDTKDGAGKGSTKRAADTTEDPVLGGRAPAVLPPSAFVRYQHFDGATNAIRRDATMTDFM